MAFTLVGITEDINGTPLVSCEVFLFKYDPSGHTLTQKDFATSDATTGAYSFVTIVDSDPAYMVTSFKDGSPNVFDVTDHFLQPVPTVAPTTTTLNPSDKTANITLSNGNLTATVASAGGTWANVRSVASHTTGKFYYEFILNNSSVTSMGIANAAWPMTNAVFVGADVNSCGWNNNQVYLNFTAIYDVQTITTTQCAVAVDLTAKLLWIRIGNGNWNNGSATSDPATGGEGADFSTIATGPYFVAVTLDSNNVGQSITFNFGASSYAQSIPSGFSSW